MKKSGIYNTFKKKIAKLPNTVYLNNNYALKIAEEPIKTEEGKSKFILINNKDSGYLLINEREAFIWESLKSNPRIRDLAVRYFRKYGKLHLEFIDTIIYRWKRMGLILKIDLYDFLSSKNEKKNILSKIIYFINIEFETRFFTTFINISYRYLISALLNKWIVIPVIFVSLIGVVDLALFLMRTIPISMNNTNTGLVFIITLISSYICLIFHELAHAYAQLHNGIPIKKTGVRLYFGIPVFFVDTTQMWLKAKSKRILVSLAGPLSHLILSGLSFLTFFFWQSSFMQIITLQFSILNLIAFLINLTPFVEFDGYYIAIDIFNIPNLRKKSFEAIKDLLFNQKINERNFFLSLFFIFSIITFVFLIITSLIFTFQNIQSFIDLF